MRYTFKQRAFTWFDTYDIYDEYGRVAFHARGQFAWGHCLKVYDQFGNEIGMVQERIFNFMPTFELIIGNMYVGCIRKRFGWFKNNYDVEYNGWYVQGSLFEYEYEIYDRAGFLTAHITKELFHFTDTYIIEVSRPDDSLIAVMFALAIDAEKCSRDSNNYV